MYLPEKCFEPTGFIQTSTGNVISRKASIIKPQGLEIPAGKVFIGDQVHIRSDLATIQLQKYVYIEEGAILRPSYMISSQALKFIPITIGVNTFIGKETIIEAACIGANCKIGKGCILQARCILKDFVQILDNTIIPPDMVLPPFALVGGSPAKVISFRPESDVFLAQVEANCRYEALILTKK